ncbi:MAG: glucose-6-phosphate isomerase [Candidatus Omnitrophota bacterium]
MLDKIDPTGTRAWKKLRKHYAKMRECRIKDLFARDPGRFERFSGYMGEIFVDYSKNIITDETMGLLFLLAEECGLKSAAEKMFSGDKINETEARAVLHTALRGDVDIPVYLDGQNIMVEVREVLSRMKAFSEKIISGEWKGYTGRGITDIVNIGIGGSDLGPRMVTEALTPYKKPGIRAHFVSNIDGTDIEETFKKIKPETVLFLVASKTFTTLETMTNARTARDWFLARGAGEGDISKHFAALSTNTEEAGKFGIPPENMFRFWDWVGGRYSLWSAIGLSIAVSTGFENFEELLKGARASDGHFRGMPFERNIPVILALISIWYINFFGAEAEAVLPYDQYMRRFPAYLQQLNMESNGKSVDRSGREVSYRTGPVVWGEPGTNGQHAFYQLLHQGTRFVPCDFIVPALSHNPVGYHHEILAANVFAQAEALMKGKTEREVIDELSSEGKTREEIKKLTPFRIFRGGRPSNTIMVPEITPGALGALIAMYEHKVFTQGVIWNIFSFDQWGVELGKQLARKIIPGLEGKSELGGQDTSTGALIEIFRKIRGQGARGR